MTKSLLTPLSSSSSLPTYAEQVKEVLAVGGDPWFLPSSSNNNNKNVLWDGTGDENAHFGGWETAEAKVAAAVPVTTTTTTTATTSAELVREVNAVGGDPSFLIRPSAVVPVDEWEVDETAHFGGWEN